MTSNDSRRPLPRSRAGAPPDRVPRLAPTVILAAGVAAAAAILISAAADTAPPPTPQAPAGQYGTVALIPANPDPTAP